MKNIITFLLSLFIAGCCATKTVTTTQREVPIVVAVPAFRDTIPATINDSTIVAKDTTTQIEVRFEIDHSVKSDSAKSQIKQKLKHALNTIKNLPIKPVVDITVKPDSVKTTVHVTDTTIREKESVGFFEYIKIIAVGFVICLFVVLLIVILIKR